MADLPNVPPEVIEALKRGDKAAALKLLMPSGGKVTSLKDVMQLLKTLQETGAVNLKVNVDTSVKVDTDRPGRTLPPQVMEALRSGNKLEAIRLLREATGAGLAEAKAAVEFHEHGGNPPAAMHIASRPAAAPHHAAPTAIPSVTQPGLAPGEVPRTGSGGALAFVAVLIAAALAAWFFLR